MQSLLNNKIYSYISSPTFVTINIGHLKQVVKNDDNGLKNDQGLLLTQIYITTLIFLVRYNNFIIN